MIRSVERGWKRRPSNGLQNIMAGSFTSVAKGVKTSLTNLMQYIQNFRRKILEVTRLFKTTIPNTY